MMALPIWSPTESQATASATKSMALASRDLTVALGLDNLVAEKAAASLTPRKSVTPLIMSDVGVDWGARINTNAVLCTVERLRGEL